MHPAKPGVFYQKGGTFPKTRPLLGDGFWRWWSIARNGEIKGSR